MFCPSMGTNAMPLLILHRKASFLTGKFALMSHILYISWQITPVNLILLISQGKTLVLCQHPEHVGANEHHAAQHYNVNTAWFTFCNFFNTVHIQIASPASRSYLLANSIYQHILFPQSCQINFHCTSIFQKILAVPTGRVIAVHFGPCGEDGSRVWEWEVYSGQHPMSKRTWDMGSWRS